MSKRRRPFVAVETDVVKDESFAVLGDVCGYNRDEALGRIFRMWAWCADRKLRDAPDGCPGYAVPEGVVVRFLGPDGVRGILGDGVSEFALGERWGDLIYLRGTEATVAARRSKIEGAAAGGNDRAREVLATGARGPDGKFVGAPTIDQPTHHLDAADSPPRTSVDPRSQIPDPAGDPPPARDPAVPIPTPPPPPAPLVGSIAATRDEIIANLASRGSLSTIEARQARRRELWGELETARRETAEVLRLQARPLPAQDPGERELASLLAAGDIDRVTTDVRHAIAMAVLEAQRDRSVQWLTGGIFAERQFRRLVGMTPEDAMRPRAGPRSSAERAPEPVRKIKTL